MYICAELINCVNPDHTRLLTTLSSCPSVFTYSPSYCHMNPQSWVLIWGKYKCTSVLLQSPALWEVKEKRKGLLVYQISEGNWQIFWKCSFESLWNNCFSCEKLKKKGNVIGTHSQNRNKLILRCLLLGAKLNMDSRPIRCMQLGASDRYRL